MRDHRYFYGGIVEKYSSTEAGFVYFEAGCGIVIKLTAGCGDRFKIDGGMRDSFKIDGGMRDSFKIDGGMRDSLKIDSGMRDESQKITPSLHGKLPVLPGCIGMNIQSEAG